MGHQRGMNFDASEAEHPRNCVHIHAEGQGYQLAAARSRRPVEEHPRGDATQRLPFNSRRVSGADREDTHENVVRQTLGDAFAPGQPVGEGQT
jgi:hypothetical protein